MFIPFPITPLAFKGTNNVSSSLNIVSGVLHNFKTISATLAIGDISAEIDKQYSRFFPSIPVPVHAFPPRSFSQTSNILHHPLLSPNLPLQSTTPLAKYSIPKHHQPSAISPSMSVYKDLVSNGT
jgi:hypothetical protein